MSQLKEQGMFDFSVLRDLRKREELTIEETSRMSGVSAAVISKLERNQTQAELSTLFRLSRVFGLNATDLISLAESRTAHKKSSREHVSGGFTFQTVSYANVESFHGFAEKGAQVSRPEIHHDDYEICWVLNGAIRIALPHETHDLRAGDALQFDAILAHTYEALEDCEILIMHLNKGKRF
jgi:transcriptional regulator with XRE-family HTH domain